MTPRVFSEGVSSEIVCVFVCVGVPVWVCSYTLTEATQGSTFGPTPETGNGSNMGLSVASLKTPGTDFNVSSGPGLRDPVRNTPTPLPACKIYPHYLKPEVPDSLHTDTEVYKRWHRAGRRRDNVPGKIYIKCNVYFYTRWPTLMLFNRLD